VNEERDLRPLAGIRVIDFTVVWAGPFGAMLLGDLGAEVIKVENVRRMQPQTRGYSRVVRKEDIRGLGAWASYPGGDPGDRPYERHVMTPLFRNKLSVTINMLTEEGMEYFWRLVEKADVFLENNVPETMEKLGITYDTLRARNPGIIMARCPAFGSTGAYKNFRAWGNHIEAVLGHTLLRGYEDSDPSETVGIYSGDYQTGATVTFAIMAALHHRAKTGQGQLIELCQVENGSQMFPQSLMDWTMNGRNSGTIGNRDVHGAAPNGVYRCRGEDRWLSISVWDDEEFAALLGVMGRPDLAGDPRFATTLGRQQHYRELDAIIEVWTRDHDSHGLAYQLQAAGVGAGPVQDASEALACPQLRERGFFERVNHKFTGTYDWPGMLFKMPVSRTRIVRPPVGLGEHNEYVYKQVLGVSDAEYDDLLAREEIGTEYDESIP
jgi:crotonobetainyl-CoA:carnitine CoA-transferase CaiB-like acyl-CoA transferase